MLLLIETFNYLLLSHHKMVVKNSKKIREHFSEVIKIKRSPHSIALGFAVGTFLAILPTPGFSILLGLLIVLIYQKRCAVKNKRSGS